MRGPRSPLRAGSATIPTPVRAGMAAGAGAAARRRPRAGLGPGAMAGQDVRR